ncbi:MAG: RNA 2',3'-cyclic phosphodiesterase [Ignavibacteriales bacterium]|nr:RNA 2',3'-cyclic phosphodiesterase [Ignavibacteriales bacterium]
MNNTRTFIAFDTPAEIKNDIEIIQNKLRSAGADVKWEHKDKFHATIKFLGDIENSRLDSIIDKITNTTKQYPPAEIIYDGIGVFPNRNNPRVIWIGCINPDGIIKKIKVALDKNLVADGFEIENRAFHPHITLGRVKSEFNLNNLLPMLENLNFEPQKAFIEEVLIMKSILNSKGSEYSVLKSIQLSKT